MKIEAKTIQEFFNQCDEYTEIAKKIDSMIKETDLYKDRKLHSSDSITVLGYGFRPYKNTCYDGVWPLLSLSPQKNNLGFYVMIYEGGKSILEKYKDVFGKSNVGVGCIRIKKLNDERIKALKEIISVAATK